MCHCARRMETKKLRVMVIDDQAVVRQGFVSLISTVADMEIVAEGSNGREAVELYSRHQPDITLMDLRMPELSGVEAITEIRRQFPGARIIVLTTYDGDEDIYRSVQAGAQGYLLKDMFFEELESAIRKVHAGARLLPGSVAERLAARMSSSELTKRHLEGLRHTVDGRRNIQAANALSNREATVKMHTKKTLTKPSVT